MGLKKYFSPIFISVTFFNLIFIDNVNGNLKESFQNRSICSAENAEFEKITKRNRYEMDKEIIEYFINRYCITRDNRIIQYSKKEKAERYFESSRTGFLGKEESSYSPINAFGTSQTTWYTNQWEIEDDQLILYSCSSVIKPDCGADAKRSVVAYKIGTLIHKNNIKNSFIDSTGGRYIGNYKDGKRHGKGTYEFVSGDKYIGDFKDGKRHGKGTYEFVSGNKYIGDIRDGKRHGKGTFLWAQGDKYTGDYKDGKRHGKGTFEWADGDKYIGDFKDDEANGKGTFLSANGDRLEGNWLEGKFHD